MNEYFYSRGGSQVLRRHWFSVLGIALLGSGCAATRERGVASDGAPVAHVAAATPADDHAKAAAHAPVASVDPSKAWGWLKNGNIRFVKAKSLRKDGQSKKDRERLAKGQHPHTIVVSCSDSRVPPELVFDQKLGELFTVRTAGESMDHGSVASIEYAAVHLGAKLIVVMGHESCGAVKATLETAEGKSAGSPHIDALISELRPRLSQFSRVPASAGVLAETSANAKGAADDLMKKSTIIRDKVLKGELQIKTAVYHLASGEVSWNN